MIYDRAIWRQLLPAINGLHSRHFPDLPVKPLREASTEYRVCSHRRHVRRLAALALMSDFHRLV